MYVCVLGIKGIVKLTVCINFYVIHDLEGR